MGFDILYLVIVIIIVVVSMTFHEAMHAYASYWLGDDTAKLSGRLSLNPIKHIDPVMTLVLPILLAISGAPVFGGAKPVPFNSSKIKYDDWGVALVAVAGPLTNLILAFILVGLWVAIGVESTTLLSQTLFTAASINLGFFIFNMLPIPPLDGSRILYAFAPDFIRRFMESLEKFGIIIVFALVMFLGTQLGYFMVLSINWILDIFINLF